MSKDHGAFIWYELMTANAAGATAFYGKVHGWSVAGPVEGPVDYRRITAADGEGVGGMLALAPEMIGGGAQPGWYAYVCVDDVDAELAALKQAGGSVFMDQDVPDVGRMAMIADPQGVPLYVMAPRPPAGAPEVKAPPFSPDTPGHVAWNELNTPDPEAAEAFYTSRFGWTRGGSMPMGPMGDYIFLNRGETPIGALMRTPEGRPSRWGFYWRTGDIDAARTRVVDAGGTVTMEPHQVPGGDWVIEATDPEGVAFGMVGARG